MALTHFWPEDSYYHGILAATALSLVEYFCNEFFWAYSLCYPFDASKSTKKIKTLANHSPWLWSRTATVENLWVHLSEFFSSSPISNPKVGIWGRWVVFDHLYGFNFLSGVTQVNQNSKRRFVEYQSPNVRSIEVKFQNLSFHTLRSL